MFFDLKNTRKLFFFFNSQKQNFENKNKNCYQKNEGLIKLFSLFYTLLVIKETVR